MNFSMAKRQAIVDGYLAASTRNIFIPSEFIDWLEGQPDHEAHGYFFGDSNDDAARKWRIHTARRFIGGLRVVVREHEDDAKVVSIKVPEYPAYLSPLKGRREGGGYVRFDPTDPELVAEAMKQGAAALRSWLTRYESAALIAGVDTTAIENIATEIEGREAAAS